MKNLSKTSKRLAVFGLVATALAGCASTPIERLGNATIAGSLPDDMVKANVAGVVAFDEQWPGNLNRIARGQVYSQGIDKGEPEYGLRIVRINLNNTGSALWVQKGQLLWQTAAYVPDQLPQLHAGDIVEVRQTGSWMTMEKLTTTGEGNIVIRVMCAKADPHYQECAERGLRTGTFHGVGPTGTPYPASAHDYGFTFTPMFDAEGHQLRPYPQSTAPTAACLNGIAFTYCGNLAIETARIPYSY